MSAHPNHGTKPLARKQMQQAQFEAIDGRTYLYKLERQVGTRREVKHGPDGLVLFFVGIAPLDPKTNRPIHGEAAKTWAKELPGWELCFG